MRPSFRFRSTYETYHKRILFLERYVRTLTYSILVYAYPRALIDSLFMFDCITQVEIWQCFICHDGHILTTKQLLWPSEIWYRNCTKIHLRAYRISKNFPAGIKEGERGGEGRGGEGRGGSLVLTPLLYSDNSHTEDGNGRCEVEI
jgi:hypothetical protein